MVKPNQVLSDLLGYWRRLAGKSGRCPTREAQTVNAVWFKWQLARERRGWLGWRRGSQYRWNRL